MPLRFLGMRPTTGEFEQLLHFFATHVNEILLQLIKHLYISIVHYSDYAYAYINFCLIEWCMATTLKHDISIYIY